MPAYRYRGMSATGRELEGVIDAASPREATSKLRDEGVFVTRIEQVPFLVPEKRAGAVGKSNVAEAGRRDDLLARLPDYREVFQPELQRVTQKRPKIGCLRILIVLATVVLMAFLWPDQLAWYWAMPIILVELFVLWWLIPPLAMHAARVVSRTSAAWAPTVRTAANSFRRMLRRRKLIVRTAGIWSRLSPCARGPSGTSD